jgi:mannitol/fructose-specific phosphotransferase system IIA component (Ntr-type)
MPELAEFLTLDCVTRLVGTTKAAALDELVTLLAGAEAKIDRDELAREIDRREAMMSTGIGHKLAIPHVRMAGVKKAVVAVGVSAEGVTDYESLDGLPVHIIVMIVAPAGEHEMYIRLLAKVSDVLKDADLREAIIAAADTEIIHTILLGGE